MKDLFNRTWFRPALLGLFALLQLALLFTVALLRPDFDAAENAYLQLIAGIENSTESSATSGNMLDICAGWGVPPGTARCTRFATPFPTKARISCLLRCGNPSACNA